MRYIYIDRLTFDPKLCQAGPGLRCPHNSQAAISALSIEHISRCCGKRIVLGSTHSRWTTLARAWQSVSLSMAISIKALRLEVLAPRREQGSYQSGNELCALKGFDDMMMTMGYRHLELVLHPGHDSQGHLQPRRWLTTHPRYLQHLEMLYQAAAEAPVRPLGLKPSPLPLDVPMPPHADHTLLSPLVGPYTITPA